ncbi:MAG: 3'-5' exonuclease [Planctomycetaceae bacterium]|jgi:predicted PolB exonuclease-like 3'-5' exonuclease|nr:3'-5' exonuclease [Planctomycetaceae bacterium]
MTESPAYFVFDVESVADAQLVSKVHFDGKVPESEAIRKYRDELLAATDKDFIPYTFQFPVSVVIAKVAADLSLMDVVALDEPHYRSHEICDKFWRGWSAYRQPTLVSFNGRSFDVPLLELAAFKYGISVPAWFAVTTKTFDQPRYRFNSKYHLDLYDVLTNSGLSRFNGGLNLVANMLGKPGKMGTQGYMVQDLYDAGEIQRINDYCKCDVLDTYFVFLRVNVLFGKINRREERKLVKNTKDWLTSKAESNEAFKQYLDNWGDWQNPWQDDDTETTA